MTIIRVIATTALVLGSVLNAWADDAPAPAPTTPASTTPPPPPKGVWMGKGQFGFLDSHSNSDAESINGNLDIFRYDGDWKNEIYAAGLYGKNSGIVSNKLALSVGYGFIHNSDPPPPIKKLDTTATVNLVFALGPQTL